MPQPGQDGVTPFSTGMGYPQLGWGWYTTRPSPAGSCRSICCGRCTSCRLLEEDLLVMVMRSKEFSRHLVSIPSEYNPCNSCIKDVEQWVQTMLWPYWEGIKCKCQGNEAGKFQPSPFRSLKMKDGRRPAIQDLHFENFVQNRTSMNNVCFKD